MREAIVRHTGVFFYLFNPFHPRSKRRWRGLALLQERSNLLNSAVLWPLEALHEGNSSEKSLHGAKNKKINEIKNKVEI